MNPIQHTTSSSIESGNAITESKENGLNEELKGIEELLGSTHLQVFQLFMQLQLS